MAIVLDEEENIAEHAGGFVMPAWNDGDLVLLWIEDAALDPLAARFGIDFGEDTFIRRCKGVLEAVATRKLAEEGLVELPTASDFETPMTGIAILAADVKQAM